MSTDIIAISVTCSKCGATTPVDAELDLTLYGSAQECELCGSHGENTVETSCGECRRTIVIAQNSW